MRKFYVAGHRGMVGGAILRQLQSRKDAGQAIELITRTHAELDLTSQAAVQAFMMSESPDVVILAAAKVGGIMANNTYPADFIYENLMIECNVIHQAFAAACETAAATWVFMHLSPRSSAANGRKRVADRPARAHKRALCHSQDCRHQAL